MISITHIFRSATSKTVSPKNVVLLNFCLCVYVSIAPLGAIGLNDDLWLGQI